MSTPCTMTLEFERVVPKRDPDHRFDCPIARPGAAFYPRKSRTNKNLLGKSVTWHKQDVQLQKKLTTGKFIVVLGRALDPHAV